MSPTDTNAALRTLSITEAAEATGLTVRMLRGLVSTRRIPYLKVGKLVRFRPSELEAWLAENAMPAVAAK
ncbi:helix-turn-helix domain-containing protein [uncultured Microbacterium sp.]|uniref:Helix-turn-helix domain-containing protein n=1 Tax=uncultured Microbacterium sp. TaxID=191216 RepID=A0A1Y5NWF7_9MICO|nr:helix-turn-helix domain-containing protein [uncultured Microbacterium sp.]SBS70797.1 hypothetical protein MIPYR_10656 [uncultured Microbacterium sp.]